MKCTWFEHEGKLLFTSLVQLRIGYVWACVKKLSRNKSAVTWDLLTQNIENQLFQCHMKFCVVTHMNQTGYNAVCICHYCQACCPSPLYLPTLWPLIEGFCHGLSPTIVQLKLFLAEKFGDNNEQVGLAVTLLDLLGLFSSGIFCFITGCLLPNVLRWRSGLQTLGSIWEEQKPQNCTASKAWKVVLLSCIWEVPGLNLGCDTSSPDRVFLVFLSFSWQILILYLG